MKSVSILFLLLLLLGVNSYGQEICDNGIDDDNDGFVDLNDSADCICESATVSSLIPNPSFEERECCPTSFTQLNCAKNWEQASAATSDYFNICGYLAPFGSGSPGGPNPILPVLDGEGYVGFHDIYSGGTAIYKEYIGTVLETKMEIGVAYQIQFYLAYVEGQRDLPMALFATEDQNNLPFGGNDYYIGCPTNVPGWDELSEITAHLVDSQWIQFSMTFIPSKEYSTIVLGPACAAAPLNSSAYYLMDHLILNKKDNFGKIKITSTIDYCKEQIILYDSEPASASKQWYKNGVAMIGETGERLELSFSDKGNYQFRYEFEDSCVVSRVFSVDSSFSFQDTCSQVTLYNVFTPGNDEWNDNWEIDYYGFSNIEVAIYNRWGEMVCNYNLPGNVGWNGKVNNVGDQCPDGTYFYILKLRNQYTGEMSRINGLVDLISE